jgi:hypothetical protein
MSTTRVRLNAIVLAASRDTAESLIEPYLDSPNSPGVYTFGVAIGPIGAEAGSVPTHYGCSTVIVDGGTLDGDLAMLAQALPGTVYTKVPWRTFRVATHWIGWLAGLGLAPIPTGGV